MSSDGNFVNLTASTINGAVVATSSEVANTTANNKVITPNTLSYILARPPTIGSATPGNASFNNINVASITGAAVASISDIASATSGKFITPSLLKSIFDSPLTLGNLTPNSGKFSSLIVTGALTLQGDIIQTSEGGTGQSSYSKGDLLVGNGTGLTKLTCGTNGQYLQTDSSSNIGLKWSTITISPASTTSSGIVQYAAATDITNLTSINTVTSPANIKTILASPPDIGATKASTAKFTNLTANTISGPAIASDITLSSTTTAVSPSTLKLILESPNTVIGNTKPNSGKFNVLTATSVTTNSLTVAGTPPWQVLQFATNAEANAGTLTNKIVSPSNLANIFANSIPIGSSKASTGKFTDLSVSGNLIVTKPPWISVSYASNTEVTAASLTNKALSPSNLTTLFASPKPIGSGSPSTGVFTTLTANTINGSLGTSQIKNPAIVTTLTADSIGGNMIATSAEITAATSNVKVLTPGNLSIVMGSPKPIGSTSPNTGAFTTLTGATIAGAMIATDTEISAGTVTNKLITPKGLSSFLNSLGMSNSGKTSTTTFASIATLSISGGVMGTTSDISIGTANNKIVSPYTMKKWIQSPDVIGSNAPNDAYFSILNFKTVNGTVIADYNTIYEATSNDSIITPLKMKSFLDSPYDIGSIAPANATFLNIDASTISGSIVATSDDLLSCISNNKIVVPKQLRTYLASPHSIGSSIANTGRFTQLTCDTLSGDVIALKADLSIKNPPNNKVLTPYTLSEFLSSPYAIGDVIPNTGTFTDITSNTLTITGSINLSNPLSNANGGTGISSYSPGDLLYVGSDSKLTKLPASTNDYVLTLKYGYPQWVSATTPVTLNVTSSEESTSTDTGALIVNGGVGISRNISIGGNIHFSGTIGRGKRTVITGSYNILESDYIIAVRTQNPITIILPDISSLMYSDKIYIIKAEISDPNISLVAGSSDTIDGTYQFIIDGSYNSISLYTDGASEWFIY